MFPISKKKILHYGFHLIEFLFFAFVVITMTVPFFQKIEIIQIPDIAAWKTYDSVTITKNPSGESGYLVEGNGEQYLYQIQSPKIRLGLLLKTYKFSLPIQVHQGNIGVGVLNGTMGKWIVPPLAVKDRYIFNSVFNLSVYIIIANINPEPSGNPPSRFTILQP